VRARAIIHSSWRVLRHSLCHSFIHYARHRGESVLLAPRGGASANQRFPHARRDGATPPLNGARQIVRGKFVFASPGSLFDSRASRVSCFAIDVSQLFSRKMRDARGIGESASSRNIADANRRRRALKHESRRVHYAVHPATAHRGCHSE